MEYYISLFLPTSCLYAGQAYGRFIQIQPSYYRVGYMVHKKNANEKRRRKLHPILTLEVTLDKQINTIECVSMDIT